MRRLYECVMVDTEINNGQIISIGLCVVNFQDQTITRTREFVCKIYGPIDPRISKLTNITDDTIKRCGKPIQEVLLTIQKEYSSKVSWGAWGQDNHILLNTQLNTMVIKDPLSIKPLWSNFINWASIYNFKKLPEKRASLTQALLTYNLMFEGNQHSAIDDAYNLGRLALKMMG